MMAHNEKLLNQQEIYSGRVFRVTKDTVLLENGAEGIREIVHHHGGAAVVALDEHGRVILVRQYRHAIGREMWEIPAGKLESGEDPFEAAKRELAEEGGVTADVWQELGVIYPTVGYATEAIYLYLATRLHPVPMHLDEDEFLEPSYLPLEQVMDWIMQGKLQDSKTVIGCMKADKLTRKKERAD